MNPKRILIIDDEDVICRACKMILDENEFFCEHCQSGKAGLELVLNKTFDLLLLDMKLKDMDGMEILAKVKQARPGLHVVVITGYSTLANTVKAMRLGASDYLSKPFTDDELVKAVKALLR
ncbi:MAG: response regulator [Pseudomonadota bacterium]